MKRLLLLLLLCPVAAQAATIEITSGFIGMTQTGNFDTVARFEFAQGYAFSSGYLMPSRLDGTTTLAFDVLTLHLVYDPVGWDEDHHTYEDRRGPDYLKPFTMTGLWNDTELAGQGRLRCCTVDYKGYPLIWVQFAFEQPQAALSSSAVAVPEPSSLVLLVFGMACLAARIGR